MRALKLNAKWEAMGRKLHCRCPMTIVIRAEQKARVYVSDHSDMTDEVLEAIFEGQEVVPIRDPCFLRVESEGRTWINFTNADQTQHVVNEDVYTTLDRPAPLSPEMLAIERLMKQNSIDRERQRETMERMFDERLARERQKNRKTHTAPEAQKVRNEDGPSPGDTSEPQRDGPASASDEPAPATPDAGAGKRTHQASGKSETSATE